MQVFDYEGSPRWDSKTGYCTDGRYLSRDNVFHSKYLRSMNAGGVSGRDWKPDTDLADSLDLVAS